MPIIDSNYTPWITNGHLQTILPNLFRKIKLQVPRTEEIATPDDDFLELDWYDFPSSKKLVIISHGLEGNSRRAYVRGMARQMLQCGYNVLAWNFRSCGTRMNRQLRFYHSGDTADIGTVIDYCLGLNKYDSISLIGFSMGGNITLKYLGEKNSTVSPYIKSAAAISVPIDLVGSSIRLAEKENQLYMIRFMRKLKRKVVLKSVFFPELANIQLSSASSFEEFDNLLTAPIHGFRDARDYWERASSKPYLENIKVPTLLLNALNDSFLSPSCYPYDIAKSNDYLYLETPATGGHVGFWTMRNTYWSEKRVSSFICRV